MKKLIALVFLFAFNFAFATVNLNTATVPELDAIKGIGPVKAKAIVDYRSKNGPFKTVDDLKKVSGFGEKTVDKLRKEVAVSGASTKPVETKMLPQETKPKPKKP
jgi:competence protein ComEA